MLAHRLFISVFCILIVGIISKIDLVFSSLLCASNYHYNKGRLEVEFFMCKTIHIVLLLIAVLQSISLQWVLNIFITSIIKRNTRRVTLCANFDGPTTILSFMSCFILNCHGTLFSSQISNLFFPVISKKNMQQSKKSINLNFG